MINTSITTIDHSSETTIVVTLKPIEGHVKDVKEYMDALFGILKNNTTKKVVIFDGSKGNYLDAEARVFIGKYLKDNKALYTSKVIDTASVTGSVMGQIVLKALMLLIDKDLRPTVFNKMSDAIEWAGKLTTEKVAA